jgi:outer membrane cobalamin receptor
MRIRGSDQTRINVTVNGIALNDAESHNVFWVNMPDFASSIDNIQIQRGVGTSTNGAAAFGASIDLQTTKIIDSAYAEISNSYGSFNSVKNTVKLGTGLLKNKFVFDGRLSHISSEGYIDIASVKLLSYYTSAAYYGKNTIIKFITFSGKEKTYQAWWGVPQDSLASNRTYNYYNYPNETDNYTQSHYQVLISKQLNKTNFVNIKDKITNKIDNLNVNVRSYYLSPLWIVKIVLLKLKEKQMKKCDYLSSLLLENLSQIVSSEFFSKKYKEIRDDINLLRRKRKMKMLENSIANPKE